MSVRVMLCIEILKQYVNVRKRYTWRVQKYQNVECGEKKAREIFGRLERCSYLCTAIKEKHIPDDSCPDGGIGRRAGLKTPVE